MHVQILWSDKWDIFTLGTMHFGWCLSYVLELWQSLPSASSNCKTIYYDGVIP